MKHITIVTRNMTAGGAERVIAQLSKDIILNNIECTIVTLDDKEIFYNLPQNVDIKPIGIKSKNNYIDKFEKYKEVRRIAQSLDTDIILAMPEEIGIFVIPAMFGTGIPVIVSERNNPWVMPWKKETRIMRNIFYPFASGFIFQTEFAASFFSKRIRKKGIVLPNPLDLNRIPTPHSGERTKDIVAAGRLVEQKNFPLLIKAFAKFSESNPEYTLVIYGEGKLKDDLENLAKSCIKSGKYRFAGKTNELLECMKDASMFVLSSDYEGMPNVLIEAMAIGMPVISTDCPSGGPAELIKNGENGLLVCTNNIEELTNAMCKIIDSKDLQKKIGENAIKIKEKFDSNIVSEQWIEYLEGRIKCKA